MALTLTQWLHPHFTRSKELQITQYNQTEENNIKHSINNKNKETPSLSYLDDYIHQLF
ncbi:elongation factor G [Crocosphaera sp. UHCC 0190]|uniref:elongation factor G n=1 Tax=Crocosphaera sp. UHCC 0190 TaxID=3110246 RepID=UPI002B1F8EBD|nr:elongation factor G [Crocosphaera sp. UHCC 0190]MEA5508876.1 elongation factor G [Crocosphaera sp. UHCC 0190]